MTHTPGVDEAIRAEKHSKFVVLSPTASLVGETSLPYWRRASKWHQLCTKKGDKTYIHYTR